MKGTVKQSGHTVYAILQILSKFYNIDKKGDYLNRIPINSRMSSFSVLISIYEPFSVSKVCISVDAVLCSSSIYIQIQIV